MFYFVVEKTVDKCDPDSLSGLQKHVDKVVDLGEHGRRVLGQVEEDGKGQAEEWKQNECRSG